MSSDLGDFSGIPVDHEGKTKPKVVTGAALLRDLVLVVGWVALSDLLLYQIGTFAAWSLFLLFTVPFLALAKRSLGRMSATSIIGVAMLLLSLKLVWCGSSLQIVCGCFLVFCYSMALAGTAPFLPEVLAFMALVVGGGVVRLSQFRLWSRLPTRIGNVSSGRVMWIPAVLLPAASLVLFSACFILANPHISQFFTEQVQVVWSVFYAQWSALSARQMLFWLVSGWILLGALYPAGKWFIRETLPKELNLPAATFFMFAAYRNTLASLSVLFVVYLGYEFATLWFREFPADFYYAGYAHQGAFWLTAALALTTLMLSVMFQGQLLRDSRMRSLKRLATIWVSLNLLLGIAALHRLFIYVEYNGMTRMRVVGILGICCVIAGMVLVFKKIIDNRGFVWLVHRQLWVPLWAVLAFATLPVDWIVNRYNVSQVTSGHPSSLVQIVAHETTASGMLPVIELLDHEDDIVRNGVRAIMAGWAIELDVITEAGGAEPPEAWRSGLGHSSPWVGKAWRSSSERNAVIEAASGWQRVQWSQSLLARRLEAEKEKLLEYRSAAARDGAINALFRDAYRWY